MRKIPENYYLKIKNKLKNARKIKIKCQNIKYSKITSKYTF